jgi:predicted ATPase
VKIVVKNFYAVKHAELELQPGISVLAGKNGAGKTQLLVAIAWHGDNLGTLQQFGYDWNDCQGAEVHVQARTLLRPSLRRIGEATRQSKYATIGATNYLDSESGQGYRWNLDERFTQLHNRVANMFFAGTRQGADAAGKRKWETILVMFKDAFGRTLRGDADSSGASIRVELPTGAIANFSTLSTGELEFIALACDLLVEGGVELFLTDELDAHFHPDLQRRVLEIIGPHVGTRHLLVSSHSPIVMLSVPPSRVFFMEPPKAGTTVNQVKVLGDDIELFESVAELYPGFVEDTRLAGRLRAVGTREIFAYARDCLGPSEVIGPDKARDSDPQATWIRTLMLGSDGDHSVVEVGAGTGRLVRAYLALGEATLKRIRYTAVDHNEGARKLLEGYATEQKLGDKFAGFEVSASLPSALADTILAPNMVHEVGPDNVAVFFTNVLAATKVGGSVVIFEQLELARGEEKFVVFDGDALDALFARLKSEEYVGTSSATPKSHSGKPLLEYLVRIRKMGGKIFDEDVIRALDVLLRKGGTKLAQHMDGASTLKALELAFTSHNVAHAVAYLEILAKRAHR